MRKEKIWIIFTAIFLCGILRGSMAVKAQERVSMERAIQEEMNSSFMIEAEALPQDERSYGVRVTVENLGENWEGTVRLTLTEIYNTPSAYDTAISLPQGSKKQFVLRVPKESAEDTNGTVKLELLDKKSKAVAQKEFYKLLLKEMDSLTMGILSDEYASLTYLDMGGTELYFYGRNYPVRLVELSQDNLEDSLEELSFLVIDSYNTGILTEEEKAAVADWNLNGGMLIVGTGTYAEDTLGGFSDYLGVSCRQIIRPADEVTGVSEDISAGNAGTGMDAGAYEQYEQKLNLLTWADLEWAPDVLLTDSQDPYTYGTYWSANNGSVCVLPYSLEEFAALDLPDTDLYLRDDIVRTIFDKACNYAGGKYANISYVDTRYDVMRMLKMYGKSQPPDFGLLKILVVLYVIFVGPLLYLILRFVKKREWYWAAVPVSAVAGIFLVFLAGRGFEVMNARVYSVTLEQLEHPEKSGTYLYGFAADNDEWSLKTAEGYEYAGNIYNGIYDNNKPYAYHIRRDGEDLYIGIDPRGNFASSFFYLKKNGQEAEGTILAENISEGWRGVTGTVTNNTDRDFENVAVVVNGQLYLYEELKAGASMDLGKRTPLGTGLMTGISGSMSNYANTVLRDYYSKDKYEEAESLAALCVGVLSVQSETSDGHICVMGAAKDWTPAVDDDCKETSYGCLYVIQ